LASLGHPCKFQRVSRLGSVTAQHSSSGHEPNFTALNRGRHLYSAGRPSRWALAHIFSFISFPGAQPRFQSWGPIPWSIGYCTEQNTDGIPSFVHCSLLRNGNHSLHQKVGVVGPFFFFWGGGSGPRPPSVVAPLLFSRVAEAQNQQYIYSLTVRSITK